MDQRMQDLYKVPKQLTQPELDMLYLSEQCAHLEERVRMFMEKLSPEDRCLLESYIQLRDDLEVLSVKQAIRFGKNQRK